MWHKLKGAKVKKGLKSNSIIHTNTKIIYKLFFIKILMSKIDNENNDENTSCIHKTFRIYYENKN